MPLRVSCSLCAIKPSVDSLISEHASAARLIAVSVRSDSRRKFLYVYLSAGNSDTNPDLRVGIGTAGTRTCCIMYAVCRVPSTYTPALPYSYSGTSSCSHQVVRRTRKLLDASRARPPTSRLPRRCTGDILVLLRVIDSSTMHSTAHNVQRTLRLRIITLVIR